MLPTFPTGKLIRTGLAALTFSVEPEAISSCGAAETGVPIFIVREAGAVARFTLALLINRNLPMFSAEVKSVVAKGLA